MDIESRPAPAESSSAKRPRSPSGDFPQIAQKVPKTHSNHVQINYLARQYPENIPLVSPEDTLPSILRLIGEYDGVLHRHESIAGNLGACPLGPILVKRFERLFDGPPKVLKSHGKEGHNPVTWLDVVEFAKNKPEQFNLEKTRNGIRVCQIYTKQSRVEISEEDYVLIASGMPQRMIPPQPIIEDEEKELGALEILEKNLMQIIQLADQVSARARQLNHRMKNRKAAIVSRRENDASLNTQATRPVSPFRDANGNGMGSHMSGNGHSRPHSPPSGFVAVNSRHEPNDDHLVTGSHFMFSQPNTDNVTIINGTSIKGVSPSTRAELMKKFFTTADRQARGLADDDFTSSGRVRSRPRASDPGEYGGYTTHGSVAIPSTPSALLPQPKTTSHYERDDGGPYKIEMVSRMEDLQRGERIMPPCDRCRRLHMDCLKNLTACMGCTKKHAKCSWKEVKAEELRDTQPRKERLGNENHSSHTMNTHTHTNHPSPRDVTTEGETSNTEADHPTYHRVATTTPSVSASAPHTRPASEPQQPARTSPPVRAVSENATLAGINNYALAEPAPPTTITTGGGGAWSHSHPGHDRDRDRDRDVDDADGNDPLAQAIMDTVDQHRARAAASEREKSAEKPFSGAESVVDGKMMDMNREKDEMR